MNTADLIERVAAEHDVAKDHARKFIDSALRPARTPGPQSRHRRAHHHRRVEEALLHTRQGPTRRAQSNTNEERHEGGLVSSRADRKTRRADSTGSAILTDRRGASRITVSLMPRTVRACSTPVEWETRTGGWRQSPAAGPAGQPRMQRQH